MQRLLAEAFGVEAVARLEFRVYAAAHAPRVPGGSRGRGADNSTDTNLEVVQTEQIKIILAPLVPRCVAFGNIAHLGENEKLQSR